MENSNNIALVTSVGNELLIVDTKARKIKKRISTQQELSHMLVLHLNKPIACVTNVVSGSVSVIDIKNEKLISIIDCGSGTEGLDITPDGKELWVTSSKDKSISIICIITNSVVVVLSTVNEVLRLGFSIDGIYCFVPNSKDGTIRVYDQEKRQQIKIISIPGKKNYWEELFIILRDQ